MAMGNSATFTTPILVTDTTSVTGGSPDSIVNTPIKSVAFGVQSITGGIGFPQMTTTQRLALTLTSAQNGNTVYDTTLNALYTVQNSLWGALSSGADPHATFILQTADASFPNAQSLGLLSGTGLLKNNISLGQGVLSTAVAGTDYYSPGNPTILRDDHTSLVSVGFTAANNTNVGSLVAIGINVASSATSVTNTVAVGNNALANITTGDSNVTVGQACMQLSTTAFQNVGIGHSCLNALVAGSANVAAGYQAGLNLEGSQNVILGNQAFLHAITTSGSIAIGNRAGISNVSYNNCILIGDGADTNSNGLTNAIAFGNGAIVALNNTMIIGAGDLSVGIGTLDPLAALHVDGLSGPGIIATGAELAVNVQGGFGAKVITVTTSYTAINNDYYIFTDQSASITITLPQISASTTNQVIVIKDVSGTALINFILGRTTDGSKINNVSAGGGGTTIVNTNFGVQRLINDGSNWWFV